MTICAKEHEGTHKGQVTCPSTGFSRPGFNSGENVNADECAAYVVEYTCLLKHQKTDCNKLTGAARSECLRLYHLRLCDICRFMKTQYHCPTSQIPSFCKYCP